MIRYLSICAGIEAFSVASHGLGFTPAAFSEIDKFASAVLAHRFGSNLPGEPLCGNAPPNIGDFTQLLDDTALRERLGRIDLLVGGTPCQAFSFAGKRLSLADARGNLTLAFAVLAHELARSHGCRNALWENVPGVLSTPDNAFGCFLGALVGADAPLDLPAGIGRWPDEGMVEGPGARAAWRLLDAQYFGLAQRRERVFVVVDLGGGADPAAVLFEPQGLRGNSPPRREAGQKPAPTVAGGARSRGGYSHDDVPLVGEAYGGGNRSGAIDVAATLTAKGQRIDFEVETFIAGPAHTLRAEGFDAGEDIAPTLRAMGHGESHPNAGGQIAVCIHSDAVARSGDNKTASADASGNTRLRPAGKGWTEDDTAYAVTTGQPHAVASGWAVRRLTPTECARLQGFPDDHSRIPWRGKPADLCPDGPQYKTYGNSMAVKVMAWLARRLAAGMEERPAA